MVTWRSREIIDSNTELELPELVVYRNRAPIDKCVAAHRYILGQAVRKISHPIADPDYELPAPIADVLPYIPFLAQGNELVAKWYLPGEDSDAFMWHQDKRIGTRVLGTLGGSALYSTVINQVRYDIHATPNTFVVAHDDYFEKVTPPEEPRSFIFIGNNLLLPGMAQFSL